MMQQVRSLKKHVYTLTAMVFVLVFAVACSPKQEAPPAKQQTTSHSENDGHNHKPGEIHTENDGHNHKPGEIHTEGDRPKPQSEATHTEGDGHDHQAAGESPEGQNQSKDESHEGHAHQ